MKRLSALAVAMSLAATMFVATPANAYYPHPGDLLFRFVSGDWTVLFFLTYNATPNRVTGESPTEDCATGAPVKIERKKKTGWVKVLAGKTNKKGKFKKKLAKAKPGKYRAHILAYTTPDGNQCFEGYGAVKRFKP